MKNARQNTKEILFIVIGFIFSVVIRYLLTDYPKMIYVYNDELRYYGQAESFITGRGFFIQNALSKYRQILYPMVIAPAFLVGNRLLQMKLISLINCLLLSSTIFPISLICRRFISEEKKRLLFYVIFILVNTIENG